MSWNFKILSVNRSVNGGVREAVIEVIGKGVNT